jgi:hypothetical protein
MYLLFFSLNQGTAIATDLFVARRKEIKQCQWKETEAWVRGLCSHTTIWKSQMVPGLNVARYLLKFKNYNLQFHKFCKIILGIANDVFYESAKSQPKKLSNLGYIRITKSNRF